jgi:hypothetical protein
MFFVLRVTQLLRGLAQGMGVQGFSTAQQASHAAGVGAGSVGLSWRRAACVRAPERPAGRCRCAAILRSIAIRGRANEGAARLSSLRWCVQWRPYAKEALKQLKGVPLPGEKESLAAFSHEL